MFKSRCVYPLINEVNTGRKGKIISPLSSTLTDDNHGIIGCLAQTPDLSQLQESRAHTPEGNTESALLPKRSRLDKANQGGSGYPDPHQSLVYIFLENRTTTTAGTSPEGMVHVLLHYYNSRIVGAGKGEEWRNFRLFDRGPNPEI